ncbi:hypothetical protein ELE66_30625, partial [Klebsiella pneumoniae]|nr:hypothetical protein [Klebsiella pneumoniae]
PTVLEGQCSPAIRQKLEDIEVQFSALQAHLLTDITATGDKVAALKDRGLFGSSEITNKIQTQQKILDERIHEWNLAMKVRAQALHLLTHAEGNTTLVRHRQQTIVHNYQEFESVV